MSFKHPIIEAHVTIHLVDDDIEVVHTFGSIHLCCKIFVAIKRLCVRHFHRTDDWSVGGVDVQ